MCFIVIYFFVLVSFLCKIVYSYDLQVSLTTAKFLKNTSPKPTTYRRINVDRNNYDFYNNNLLVELGTFVNNKF